MDGCRAVPLGPVPRVSVPHVLPYIVRLHCKVSNLKLTHQVMKENVGTPPPLWVLWVPYIDLELDTPFSGLF
jgi:hypothetical protein